MIKTAVAASEPGRAASSRDPRTRNFAGRARPRLAAMPAFAWLVAAPAQAGVEFVTEAGGCSKVDTIGDGKDLRLSNAGTVSARIVSVRSGPQNAVGFLAVTGSSRSRS